MTDDFIQTFANCKLQIETLTLCLSAIVNSDCNSQFAITSHSTNSFSTRPLERGLLRLLLVLRSMKAVLRVWALGAAIPQRE